jgi:hypothetical protein
MVYCPEVNFPNNKLAWWILQRGRTLTWACVRRDRRSAEKEARENKERAIMVGCFVTCIYAVTGRKGLLYMCETQPKALVKIWASWVEEDRWTGARSLLWIHCTRPRSEKRECSYSFIMHTLGCLPMGMGQEGINRSMYCISCSWALWLAFLLYIWNGSYVIFEANSWARNCGKRKHLRGWLHIVPRNVEQRVTKEYRLSI